MQKGFLLFLFICSYSFGQDILDKPISVNLQNCSLDRAISLIGNQNKIHFSYNSKQIKKVDKLITQSFKDVRLQEILDYILKDTPIKYKEIGHQITLYTLSNTSEKAIISGYIREAKSQEEIVGAKIYFPEYGVGCITNTYGFYSIELVKGMTTFRVSSIGMQTETGPINIESEMFMNISLAEDTILLKAIKITADSIRKTDQTTDIPSIKQTNISISAVQKVPGAAGATDLLRHIQQFPGVQPSNDGTSNFQVRGSSSGGNLILIDEIPIYHPTHMLGIYSIVNTDAIKSATFYKDYIPVEFGTRNASVLQITTKEGDLNKYHVYGGISPAMARLNIEGPIKKNISSFYVSGRQSTFPGALNSILRNELGSPRFFDLNGKINVHINSNNRIYLTGYMGEDELTDSASTYKWGNKAGSFRWNHIINPKNFSNLSIVHSEFAFGYRNTFKVNGLNIGQKVLAEQVTYDITNYNSGSLKIKYGLSATYQRTIKGNYNEQSAKIFLERSAIESGLYGSIEKKFSRKLKLNVGIRIPFSFHIGTGDTTVYLNENLALTEVIYEEKKLYDLMFYIDPRILLSYRVTAKDEIQISSTITSQHMHRVSYINYFLPLEIWTPSNRFLKPERNYQSSIGWMHNTDKIQLSTIAYIKHVRNVLDFASPVYTSSTDIESNLLSGNLNVFGFEFMSTYQFTTWYSAAISYAFTKTKQKVIGINNDQPYPVKFDRPHYFTFSQYFNLTKKWQITSNLIIHSGSAVTLPNGQFILNGTAFPIYSENRNSERLPNFRRLDLGFKRNLGVKRNKQHFDIAFTITNFFGKYNPSSTYLTHAQNQPDQLEIRAFDYSPFMISITLNYKF
jgi:hypothetical protein